MRTKPLLKIEILLIGVFLFMGPAGTLLAQTKAPSSTPTPTLREYVVQDGDDLWDIADAFYGKPWIWPQFLKFNSIPDPNLIYPGQKLLVPTTEVLLAIQEKSPEEVKKIRDDLEAQGTPVPVASLPPQAPASAGKKGKAPEALSPSPSPTPQASPTFKITGSKTINFSYGEAVGNSLT